MSDARSAPDWAAIERDYAHGDWSIKKIARFHGLSDTAIRKRAAAHGWVRENAPVVPAKLAAPVVPSNAVPANVMAGVGAVDAQEIINRGQSLVFSLLAELEAVGQNVGAIEGMIAALDVDDRTKAAFVSAVGLRGRADVVKSLATAFKTWAESKSVAPLGKKEERQEAAKEVAAKGKFAAPQGPRLVSNRA